MKKALNTEIKRLKKLYWYYVEKALSTIYYNQQAYEAYLDCAFRIRLQMDKINAEIEQMEGEE